MQFIYVVRHGETDANSQGVINDKNVKIPLNGIGRNQARKTGKYFAKIRKCAAQRVLSKNSRSYSKDVNPVESTDCVIYSSPSTRAVQTADLIAKELNIEGKNIIHDDRLVEANHGLLSGVKKGDKLYEQEQKMVAKFYKDYPDPIEFMINLEKFDKIWAKKFKAETMSAKFKRIRSFFDNLPKKKYNYSNTFKYNPMSPTRII
jgi:broad specificity phosphatase PhoE